MTMTSNPALATALSLLHAAQSEQRRADGALSRSISTAAENAAHFAINRMIDAHDAAMSASDDAQSLGRAVADTAANGLSATRSAISRMQAMFSAPPSQPDARERMSADIAVIKRQLRELVSSSAFAGENWLVSGIDEMPGQRPLVTGTAIDGNGMSVSTDSVDIAETVLIAFGDAKDGILTRPTDGHTASGEVRRFHLLDAGSARPPEGSEEIDLTPDSNSETLSGMASALQNILGAVSAAEGRVRGIADRLDPGEGLINRLATSFDPALSARIDPGLGDQDALDRASSIQAQLAAIPFPVISSQSSAMMDIFL